MKEAVQFFCICVLFCFLTGTESSSFYTHSKDSPLSFILIPLGDMLLAYRKPKKSYFMTRELRVLPENILKIKGK